MNFRRSTIALLLLCVLPSGGRASAPDADPLRITPDVAARLLAEAQSHSHAIAAAGARAEAASQAAEAVRVWEDPVFSLGIWKPGVNGFTSSQMGNVIYGIEQKLPTFGRPDLMRGVAQAEASRERLGVGLETQKLRRDIRAALIALALADARIGYAVQSLGWLEDEAAAVDARYRVGKSREVDWLRAQTAKVQAADLLTTLRAMREDQEIDMNRLLNRDLHGSWPIVALPAVADPVPFDERLVSAALEFEPNLRILRQESVQQGAAAKLTRRQRLPEIGLGLEARQYSGDGSIREGTLTVDLSLPWINRRGYDADLRRDHARIRAAEEETLESEQAVREAVHHDTVDLDAARRQALLYRDQIIPLTEQTLASARAAWENDLGTFQDVLEAHQMLVANQQALAEATSEQARRLADLTLLTGIDTLAPDENASKARPDTHPFAP